MPALVDLTKCDKEKPMRRAARVRELGASAALPAAQVVTTSAQTKLGIPELWAAIERALR